MLCDLCSVLRRSHLHAHTYSFFLVYTHAHRNKPCDTQTCANAHTHVQITHQMHACIYVWTYSCELSDVASVNVISLTWTSETISFCHGVCTCCTSIRCLYMLHLYSNSILTALRLQECATFVWISICKDHILCVPLRKCNMKNQSFKFARMPRYMDTWSQGTWYWQFPLAGMSDF